MMLELIDYRRSPPVRLRICTDQIDSLTDNDFDELCNGLAEVYAYVWTRPGQPINHYGGMA